MELNSCCNTHFIRAIKGGVVTKVLNRDSRGRPGFVSKTLQDVYKSEDAKRMGRSPSINTHNNHAGLASDYEPVKCEIPCLPTVTRMLREAVECFPLNGDGLNIDLDDDTTLKQLRDRFLTKKQKFSCCHKSSNRAYVDEKPLEDISDLDEPLINLKSKKSKNSKAKRKRKSTSVVSSLSTSCNVKSEEIPVSENSVQVFSELAPVVSIKVEVHEAEEVDYSRNSLADDSSLGHNEGLSCEVATNTSQTFDQHDYTEEYHDCVTNEISYDHLDIKPMSMLVPWEGMGVKSEGPELDCHECLDLHPLVIDFGGETFEIDSCRSSPPDDQKSYFSSHSSISCMSEHISSSDVQVSVISTGLPYEQHNSLRNPNQVYGSYHDSTISLKTDDSLVSMEDTTSDKDQPLFCTLDGIKSNGLTDGDRDMEEELLRSGIKKSSASPKIGETQSCINKQCVDILSSPEPRPHPEKLLSERKVISPSSRERLCLAMNSEEHCKNVDQHIISECKGKLFEKQSGKKASSSFTKVTINKGGRGRFIQRNSLSHAIKKSKNAKCNFEGLRSRTFPNLSTACNTIHGCSESAIEFSLRQMHGMEKLAAKLMSELNSMKDIVEQKLLFKAYRSTSLKNDADEVKLAISNASKVEKAGRKWLTLMSRDCNRFCKIMKMTPQSVVDSKDTTFGSRGKKIRFADDDGGELCHVKFFDVGLCSTVSDEIKKDGHST